MEPATPATPAPSQSLLASGITPELSLLSGGGSADALVLLAQQQANRDAVVGDVRRELERVKEQLASSEASEASLKEQLREVKMTDVRAAASTDYVKCLVLKLLTLDEREHFNLFPALATCLQFSEADVAMLTEAREAKASRGRFSSLFGGGGGGGGRSLVEATPSADMDNIAERALELSSRAQGRAKTEDGIGVRTLIASLSELDEEVAALVGGTRQKLESEARRLSATEKEMRSEAEKREAESGERLYLRNVILRYMENEDHHTMFPVIATCLKFTQEEVAGVAEKKAKREKERRGWRLFG